jgi:glycosyltransferase involved in cell wall biosynthesis
MTGRSTELVVLSDDWHGLPSSCKHLISNLGDDFEITWVDTIGLREPSLSVYDLMRSLKKVAGWFKKDSTPQTESASALPPGVQTFDPVQLPFIRWAAVRRFNARNILRAIGPKSPDQTRIVMTTWPFMGDVLGQCDADLKVYYRVDHFHKFPGVNEGLILDLENRQLAEVDLLIGSALELLDLDIEDGKKCYLPHGVDYEHFAAAMVPVASRPSPGENITVGFFGIVDEWIDLELIAGMARLRPGWTFKILGPHRCDVSPLQGLDNVQLQGAVPYPDLPAQASCFDVGLIPFIINELTLAVNPLKLMEYFAMGLPVLSTPLPEVVRLGELVAVAETPEASVTAVEKLLADRSMESQAATNALALAASWRSRGRDFKKFLNDTGRVIVTSLIM